MTREQQLLEALAVAIRLLPRCDACGRPATWRYLSDLYCDEHIRKYGDLEADGTIGPDDISEELSEAPTIRVLVAMIKRGPVG